jgi:hypothetical protein
MRRATWLTGFVVLVVMAFAPMANAGESKGPSGPGGSTGGTTPINGFWTGDGAASICSFSGLNDVIDASEPTRTQSYGTFVVLAMKSAGVSVKEAKALVGEAPSQSCNPNRAPFGNPKKA